MTLLLSVVDPTPIPTPTPVVTDPEITATPEDFPVLELGEVIVTATQTAQDPQDVPPSVGTDPRFRH